MTTHAWYSLLFAPSGQSGSGMGVLMLQIGLFVAIFYFLSSAPSASSRKSTVT